MHSSELVPHLFFCEVNKHEVQHQLPHVCLLCPQRSSQFRAALALI